MSELAAQVGPAWPGADNRGWRARRLGAPRPLWTLPTTRRGATERWVGAGGVGARQTAGIWDSPAHTAAARLSARQGGGLGGGGLPLRQRLGCGPCWRRRLRACAPAPPAAAATSAQVLCWRDVTFGRHGWQLPRCAAPHPDPGERCAVFGAALLEGRVLPSFAGKREGGRGRGRGLLLPRPPAQLSASAACPLCIAPPFPGVA